MTSGFSVPRLTIDPDSHPHSSLYRYHSIITVLQSQDSAPGSYAHWTADFQAWLPQFLQAQTNSIRNLLDEGVAIIETCITLQIGDAAKKKQPVLLVSWQTVENEFGSLKSQWFTYQSFALYGYDCAGS